LAGLALLLTYLKSNLTMRLPSTDSSAKCGDERALENMSATPVKLAKPPIAEAVVDINCDMPPSFELAALEKPARLILSHF
jgi:hypothetical protein